MDALILSVAIPVAIVSAIRGIWSPCGLSMLSSITPMTEAGRGNKFSVTAGWFLVGGILGGLSLGLIGAGGAALLSIVDLSVQARLGLGALAALAFAAVDFGIGGIDLPIFKRQVNDAWLRTYRSWVYGAGFGWQIGFGVATYIMTAGIFLMIALAVLTAAPLQAIVIGLVFGLVRGSAVFLGRSATSPAALGQVHERLDATGPAARDAAAWIQVVAAAVLAAVAWHPLVVIAVMAAALASTRARAGIRPGLGSRA